MATIQVMLQVTFEHVDDKYPEVTEGPFEWIEMMGHSMFGLRPGDDEAEEIAGVNKDGSWDAGPSFDPCFVGGRPEGRRVRRYTRWTISPVTG